MKKDLLEVIDKITHLREEFWKNLKITGEFEGINVELEKANRVADFIELGELMAKDALDRRESCGGHFREESQTEEGEAKRDDEKYSHVAAWEYTGEGNQPLRNTEQASV